MGRFRISSPVRRLLGPALALVVLSCGGGSSGGGGAGQAGGGAAQPGPAASGGATAQERFARAADEFFAGYLQRSPTVAVSLGFHDHDGKLPDVSAAGLASHVAWLKDERTRFEAIPAGDLDERAWIEREVILGQVRGDLFDLDVVRWPMVNPMYYLERLALTDYISRDYAPLAERARGVIGIGKGAAAYLASAQANLPEAIPRTWIDTALLQVDGLIEFAKKDVVEALSSLGDAGLTNEVGESLLDYAGALTAYREFLAARQSKATDDFAIGPERFLQMLADKEGLSIDLARLEQIGNADLERNLAAMEKLARQIDGRRAVAVVVDRAGQDRPAASKLLAEADVQSAAMRKLLVDRRVVTIPSEDVAETRLSPPFLRWNFAFLSSPGVFEKKALPSFYYISPPDPKWPRKEQKAYIPSRGDLLYTTVHEVWPGHFLHYLHLKRHPSRIVRSFCTYSMGEGWAHYTEEMMHEVGASGDDPKAAIGQLTNALLRNVRFVSAVGLHTRGMKVAESIALFEEKAFADRPTARQQAVRGTFDPGYLNYTLGKLVILKLRADWKAKVGAAYSLQAFHDELLSHGCAPLPVIRRAMLGPDAGPAL
jgi:uncharacterized protein (DUF885 family)